MLVLTRKVGEHIQLEANGPVDGPINVFVLGVRGGQVKVGIDAPKTVGVSRKEQDAKDGPINNERSG